MIRVGPVFFLESSPELITENNFFIQTPQEERAIIMDDERPPIENVRFQN